ncbi:MAG: hypothetical protein HY848_12690 [Betaproteobacteria bacterium]|nr:hypothetical protein [Betaproteobacteria bacterium]
MSCTACTLIPVGNGWIAECGTARQGPYLSKGVAFRIVVTEALVLRRNGQPVRISVQDGSGTVSAEFCLCDHFQFASQVTAALSASTPH